MATSIAELLLYCSALENAVSSVDRKLDLHRKERILGNDPAPWLCDDCDCRYAQKGKLKVHIKTAHPNVYNEKASLGLFRDKATKAGKPFPCPVPGCVSGFHQTGSRNRHIRQSHPDINILPDD